MIIPKKVFVKPVSRICYCRNRELSFYRFVISEKIAGHFPVSFTAEKEVALVSEI